MKRCGHAVYLVGQRRKMQHYKAKIEFRDAIGDAVTCGHIRSHRYLHAPAGWVQVIDNASPDDVYFGTWEKPQELFQEGRADEKHETHD